MERCAVRLLEIAVTRHTLQLPPRFAAGMAVGAEVATTCPAVIRAILVGTELLLGVDGPLASSCERDQRWWGTRSLGTGLRRVLTGVTQRLVEEASKGLRVFGALTRWACRLGGCRARASALVGPQHMEHNAQPHKGEQQEVVENRVRYHGGAPHIVVKWGYHT